MENITASFYNREDMERATEALRQQGAVDIKLDFRSEHSMETVQLLQATEATKYASGSENACIMNVVVESSRLHLAHDLIARFGGNVT
ncbi:hypothetical protein ACFQI7_32220 [Paenibacillus allorhizosphaerae]|uniref:Uncharacterized protein n=1 Tax=Paenibacillus allorhizosphaerae TaxID=2849866 RepID=A0ABM8VQD6_9BACL|nr:hypothetical protein [Paenibacillus allorhizosphaerae]CAG7654080.1 hypothetical protein PAECIP111802_05672 [Paenibacillus allorhizosphaerae]